MNEGKPKLKPEPDKTLSTEKLPDPTTAAADLAVGSPRTRTAEHLRKILSAGLSLPLAAGLTSAAIQQTGNTQTPPAQGTGQRQAPAPTPPLPPPPPPFRVVDPPPPPPPRLLTGFLAITSTPVANIEIDGKVTGLKTPQTRIELTPGAHTVKLTSASAGLTKSFAIQIRAGVTLTENYTLQAPSPAPPPANDKK